MHEPQQVGAAQRRREHAHGQLLWRQQPARKDVGGQPWVEVGASSDGQRDGWLPAAQTSDWKQSLVLRFTERSGRSPVMFLDSASAVETLLGDPTKAKEKLGWVPEITVEQMCAEMVAEDLKVAQRHAFLKAHGHDVPVATEN